MSEISEIFRKAALFGIGAIALSQEKLEEFVQEMVKKGEINREDGKKFVMEIVSEKNRQCKDVEERISRKVKDVIENTGVACKKDVEELSNKTESLSVRMERIEASIERLKKI